MFSWASDKLEKLSQAVAPPPTDAVSRYLYCVQQGDEDGAMGCLAEIDPLSTVIQPSKGTLPLHLACLHGMIRLIRRIMAIPGANIEVFDLMGNTPLHHACMSNAAGNAVNVARMLVTEYSASVLARNSQKLTPYEVATLDGIRQYLLPLQLQQETQQAIDNGGIGLPPGIDMGGLRIKNPAVGPPPMGAVNGAPPVSGTHGAPPPQAGQMFATPSPTQPSSYHHSQRVPSESATAQPSVPTAPRSGNRSDDSSKYAMQGHSSAAILSSARFRPDGFHSSSSDVNLQRKYGHVGTPPSSGNHVPPPPSSGNSSMSGPPSGGSGPNPFAAGASALGGGGRRGRYPVYATSGGTVVGGAAPLAPHSGGYAYAAAAPDAGPAPSYTVFGAPAGAQPQTQPQLHPSGIPQPVPSPTAASNPTSPYLPPPPYQGQAQTYFQPPPNQSLQQPLQAQAPYQQQYPTPSSGMPPVTDPTQPVSQQTTPTVPPPAATEAFGAKPVATHSTIPMQSPPAMPAQSAMVHNVSTDSTATAEELFAAPVSLQAITSNAPSGVPEPTAATAGANDTTEISATSAEIAAELFGTGPLEAIADAQKEAGMPPDGSAPSQSDGTTKSHTSNATDFFESAPQEATTLETKADERVADSPAPAAAEDLEEEPLDEVSLSPAASTRDDSVLKAASEPSQSSEAVQPEALFSSLPMPPPPFSAPR